MLSISRVSNLFYVSLLAGQLTAGAAFAVEQSDKPAPEFKKYQIAQATEQTADSEVMADIERRLSGVQKQVTVLHAKTKNNQAIEDLVGSLGRGVSEHQSDIRDLKINQQKTRDQVARITAELRDRNQKLEERLDIAEKKITHLVNIIKLQKENRK